MREPKANRKNISLVVRFKKGFCFLHSKPPFECLFPCSIPKKPGKSFQVRITITSLNSTLYSQAIHFIDLVKMFPKIDLKDCLGFFCFFKGFSFFKVHPLFAKARLENFSTLYIDDCTQQLQPQYYYYLHAQSLRAFTNKYDFLPEKFDHQLLNIFDCS